MARNNPRNGYIVFRKGNCFCHLVLRPRTEYIDIALVLLLQKAQIMNASAACCLQLRSAPIQFGGDVKGVGRCDEKGIRSNIKKHTDKVKRINIVVSTTCFVQSKKRKN